MIQKTYPEIQTKLQTSMQLIYIAAPYRAETTYQISNNIHEASLMAQYYWLRGFAVICPQLNTAHFDGLIPDATFLAATMLMLSKCSHIALHPNWSFSPGCMEEYLYAIENNIMIHYTDMFRVYNKLGLRMGDI